jgi:hypothetical protein
MANGEAFGLLIGLRRTVIHAPVQLLYLGSKCTAKCHIQLLNAAAYGQ